MDPQGNTTSGLGVDKNEVEDTLYELLVGQSDVEKTIVKDVVENVDLIPSNVNLSGAEIELVGIDNKEYILKEITDKIKNNYDYIIIDCPPSLNMLTINALTAATSVLVPIQCEYYALEGLSQLIHTIDLVKDLSLIHIFISIASADVKSIKFVIDKKEVTFEKDGDSWVKSDETGFPVDQDKIDTLVSSLNSIKAERTLENVEDASEYELDQPDNTITVTTEDGETTVIQLGMENDSTSQEYIDLNKDSSTVYVVSNSTFSSFEGTLYDFAKSGVFPTVDVYKRQPMQK